MSQSNPEIISQVPISKKELSKSKSSISVLRIFRYIVLTALAAALLMPLVWTISASLKPSSEIFSVPIKWIPSEFHWDNYSRVLSIFPMVKYSTNTLIITICAIIGQVLSSVCVAYGFARFRHPLANVFFLLVLATMMIPGQVTMIPQFLMYKEFGWINTYLPLIVPNYFGAAINIFLLRQFIMGIPKELDESAKMDGCSSLGILTRIIAPMCKPIIITIMIWTFNHNWNDFMGPLIYLNDPEKFTLQLGIYSLNAGQQGQTDFGMMFAATLMALVPTLLLFAVGQKYFMSGIKLGGALKG
ncbi:carbohydrate ABC transporter permease [Neobacillus drentensis]|uniref:carbohydrate ABC transporter permease n=1 Tax=Neobacillus TaxID=2675232 RepID=UPI003003A552